jgi:hypothetical protein
MTTEVADDENFDGNEEIAAIIDHKKFSCLLFVLFHALTAQIQ